MTVSNEFWESLGICTDDIEERKTRLGPKIYKRLANKLDKLSHDFREMVPLSFDVYGTSFIGILKSLERQSSSDFMDLYALATFAENKISSKIIYEIATENFEGELKQRVKNQEIDSVAVLLPLFKKDPMLIRDVYYAHLVQCSPLKKHESDPRIVEPLDFKKISAERIDNLLQKYEEQRDARLRRPIKLWWLTKTNEEFTIVFRREKRASSQVKLVEKNMFRKTGDEKIFTFSDNGNVLEMCSRREPLRTLKIAQYIISELTGKDIDFLEVLNSFKPAKVDQFINRLTSKQIKDASLVSLKVKNTPIAESPILELECNESLLPALDDLKNNHDLNVIVGAFDILGLRLKILDRNYALKFKVESGEIEIIFDNRTVRGGHKQDLINFLDNQIGK